MQTMELNGWGRTPNAVAKTAGVALLSGTLLGGAIAGMETTSAYPYLLPSDGVECGMKRALYPHAAPTVIFSVPRASAVSERFEALAEEVQADVDEGDNPVLSKETRETARSFIYGLQERQAERADIEAMDDGTLQLTWYRATSLMMSVTISGNELHCYQRLHSRKLAKTCLASEAAAVRSWVSEVLDA